MRVFVVKIPFPLLSSKKQLLIKNVYIRKNKKLNLFIIEKHSKINFLQLKNIAINLTDPINSFNFNSFTETTLILSPKSN